MLEGRGLHQTVERVRIMIEVLKYIFVHGLGMLFGGLVFSAVLYLMYEGVCSGIELLIPWLGEPVAFFSMLILFVITGVLSVVALVWLAGVGLNTKGY